MYGHTSDISSLSDDERPNAIAALNQTGNIDSIVVNLRNQTCILMTLVNKISKISKTIL